MCKVRAGFVALVLLIGASSGWAGTSKPDAADVAFASAGIGFGSQGVGGALSLNFSRGDLVFVLRMSTTEEFDIFGPSPALSDTDYAVLAGKRFGRGRRLDSLAAGVALVRSVRRGVLVERPGWFGGGRYEKLDSLTVGLPIDVKTTLNFKVVGVGLNMFGNLNPKGSFAGLALTLQLGKLR